jgi:hypothetical protein
MAATRIKPACSRSHTIISFFYYHCKLEYKKYFYNLYHTLPHLSIVVKDVLPFIAFKKLSYAWAIVTCRPFTSFLLLLIFIISFIILYIIHLYNYFLNI